MSLDVFVGPLGRYYGGDWHNTGERPAPSRTRPASAAGREQERIRIQQAVLAWRETLSASLGSRVSEPLEWEESAQAPYFTGRPGWDGFGSLVLWAAYAEHPTLRAPATLPAEKWDDDPALVRSNEEGFRSRYSHLVRNVELWLPLPFAFIFEGEDVDRRRIVIGSSSTLARQLGDLNAATWKAGDGEAEGWARRKPEDSASLELHARHAFAVMTDLVRKAVDNRLPMKLDF